MIKTDSREALLQKALDLKGRHWILELATGSGKTKIALEKIKQNVDINKFYTVLIVVPRNVNKEEWKKEIQKWWPKNNCGFIYTTYVSLPKHKNKWDFVIFDECHHLSDRCKNALLDFNIGHALFLSATISKGIKASIYDLFSNVKALKADLRDVIDDGILPDPKVFLLPLTLNNTSFNQIIVKNPKAEGEPVKVHWKDRWNYSKVKNIPIHIYCTEQQYLHDLNSQIDWWKRRYMQTRNQGVKAKWLKLCGDRLNWLSRRKDNTILKLLKHLNSYRTLTFCSSIEQTEILGSNCINSKNDNSEYILHEFNKNDRIHHITACNMLNEGINLHNCQIGIYANVNSSEIIVKQRAGRLLRHKSPVIIIPYYKGTREEELVKQMMENYNSKLVKRVNFIEEIKI